MALHKFDGKLKSGFYNFDLYNNKIYKRCACGELFDKAPPAGENCEHGLITESNITDKLIKQGLKVGGYDPSILVVESLAIVPGCILIKSVTYDKTTDTTEANIDNKSMGSFRNVIEDPLTYSAVIRPYDGRNIMELRSAIRKIEGSLKETLAEREEPIELLITALLSRTNIVFYGLPGLAKTMMIEKFMEYIYEPRADFNHYNRSLFFNIQMNKFIKPEKVYGTMDFHRMRTVSDTSTSITPRSYSLLTSCVANLDEIFKGQGATLQTLLSVANPGERKFVEGAKQFYTDLDCIVSASNEEPDEKQNLDALSDRFVIKHKVRDITIKSMFTDIMSKSLSGTFDSAFDEDDRITISEFKYLTTYLSNFSSKVDTTTAKHIAGAVGDLRDILNATKDIEPITTRKYNNTLSVIIANYFLKYSEDKDPFTIGAPVSFSPKILTVAVNTLWNKEKHADKIRSTVYNSVDPDKFKIQKTYEMFITENESYRQKLMNLDITSKSAQDKKALEDLKNSRTILTAQIDREIDAAKKANLAYGEYQDYKSKISYQTTLNMQAKAIAAQNV
jgi:hypothetical protein